MGYELVALCYKKYSSLNAFGINFLGDSRSSLLTVQSGGNF